MSDSNSSDEDDGFVVYTPHEILHIGLSLLGYSEKQLNRKNLSENTKEDRLISHYGANSFVVAQLWEDLHSLPTDADDRLDPSKSKIDELFMALYFLKLYEKENPRASRFNVCVRNSRDRTWFYVRKIQGLKPYKIYWVDTGDDVWALSVDGTHFRSQERRSATRNKDPKLFSYKHNCAGFNYEIGICLFESRVMWMNGPFEAGIFNDIKVFEEKGLANKLRATGKKCISDGGYRGFPDLVSTPNNGYDVPEVAKFKSRARLRHEKFNGMLKTFECLSERFRHGANHADAKAKLCSCIEASAVICQYKMEFGEPLYDI